MIKLKLFVLLFLFFDTIYNKSFVTTTLFSARSCPDWHYKDALGHNWGSWTDYSSSQHKHTCSRCGSVEYGSHSWTTTKAATCTATGSKKCNTCGRTETIAALGHSWTTTKSATCGAAGSKKCSRCSTTSTIAATGNHTKPSGAAAYPDCTHNVCCTVCGTQIYAELECGGETGKYSLLYNYYSQNFGQWLLGNCTKYEACAQATQAGGTCNKVWSSSTVKHKDQGSHEHV